MQYNCSLIKVDWLDACIALRAVGAIVRIPPALAEYLHNPPAIGKQVLITEEIYHTLLTNKKQGNLD